MEVLISTFVLSIGLLGLAALIPVGRHAIVEGAKMDRSAACGRAGLRDIKARNIVNCGYWLIDGNSWYVASNAINPNEPIVIDPMGITRGMPTTMGPLRRANLSLLPFSANPPQSPLPYGTNEADIVFQWRDDQIYNIPTDATRRPQALGTHEGQYTWLLTLAPSAMELTAPLLAKTSYTASVAVCYRRIVDPQTPEQVVQVAQFLGGGDVVLRRYNDPLNRPVNVKAKQWLLLYAPSQQNPPRAAQCHWYRVVSAPEPAASGDQAVTLAGPDWNVQQSQSALAVVIDTVIGVYVEDIELEGGFLLNDGRRIDPLWMKY